MFLTAKEVYSGNLIIVNAAHPYHEEASKIRLRPVRREAPDILLEEHALLQLSGLMAEINGWEGIVPVSGWRSFEEQQNIFETSLQEDGEEFTRKFVALPGCSEHQTGLAIDLALKKEKVDFICPDFPYEGVCQRFRERAAAYGFIERYQEEKKRLTGIAKEPWHFRYVGRPHAQIMKEQGMCLEEYGAFLKQFPYGKRYYCWRDERMGEAQREEVQGGEQKGARSKTRKEVRISYLAAEEDFCAGETEDYEQCEISGDNQSGFIITIIKNIK